VTDASSIPVTDLLPHGPEMTLIDRLVSYDPRKCVAVVAIDRTKHFFAGGGVPAWVGIEYMAQTIAARAGYEARLRGEPPAIGFLLGTRSYASAVDEFPDGCTLTINVEPLVVDGGVSAFQCSIVSDRVLATAVVNTYQPSAAEIAGLRAATAP
jgi:predicted hotdog family 3-hydroxylacyl-ACP dehydratase